MRYLLFDRWDTPRGDLPSVIKAIRTRATDATDTLDVTTIGEINKDERIVIKDSMGRWAEYICQSPQTQRANGLPVTIAYCTGSIAELSRAYIEDKRNRNTTALTALTKALDGTRWQAGTVETTTLADTSFYHTSALDAIQTIADTYELEIQTEYLPDPTGNRIDTRIIHLRKHVGQPTATHRFEYGKDLTQITRTIDSDDVITRLYGWGKGVEATNDDGETTGGYGRKISFADINNGEAYVEDTTALADWGIPGPDGTKRHSAAAVDFPDCDDPEELLALTRAELAKRTRPTVSYTADVAALGQAGMDADGIDVGDSVHIVDTMFTTPLRLEGRVLQIEEDLAGPLADTKITLGNIRRTYTQSLTAQQQAIDKLVSNSGAWNGTAAASGTWMQNLIDRINQIMNQTGGYTYLKPGQGIYVYDRPEDQNPTQCIQIGGGYWRIADSKTPAGDWDWRTLATGRGLVADQITTGRLGDGASYWDFNTHELNLSGTFRNFNSTDTGIELNAHVITGKQNGIETLELDPNITYQSGMHGARVQGMGDYLVIGAPHLAVATDADDNGTICAEGGMVSLRYIDTIRTTTINGQPVVSGVDTDICSIHVKNGLVTYIGSTADKETAPAVQELRETTATSPTH